MRVEFRHIFLLPIMVLVGIVVLASAGRLLAESPAADNSGMPSIDVTPSREPAESPARTGAKVYWLPIREEITPRLTLFVKRTLEKAKEAGVDYVILDINTPGGLGSAMEDIGKDIASLEEVTTVAFVNTDAASAGAYISLSCDIIVMAEGSQVGSSALIFVSPSGGIMEVSEEIREKMVSHARALFRAMAKRKGRNPDLAEAMVDQRIWLKWVTIEKEDNTVEHRIMTKEEADEFVSESSDPRKIVCEDIVTDKQLVNLDYKQAVKYGFADGWIEQGEGHETVLNYLGLKEPQIFEYEPTISENLYNIITSPFVTTLLLLLAVGGIYMEFTTPGFGVPGIIGCGALLLILTIGFVLDTANVWTVMLVFAGIILLAVELFVIPGFGVTGLLGVIFMVAGITLSLVPFGIPDTSWEMGYLLVTLRNVGLGIAGSVVLVVVLLRVLPRTPGLSRIALQAAERVEQGYVSSSAELRSLTGSRGVAITKLRPAGKAEFGEGQFQVVAEGEFIEKGENVEVIDVTGNRIVVRKA